MSLPPELLALIREAKERPEDDTPRLVLGDWLTDHDDPRGEYIRRELRAHRLIEDFESADAPDVQVREDEKAWVDGWLGPLRELAGPEGWAQLRRGLIHVSTEAARLVDPKLLAPVGEELLAWVDEVTLRPPFPDPDRLARSPLLASGARFSVQSSFNQEAPPLQALAGSPLRGRLSGLRISGNVVKLPAVLSFLRAPGLDSLTELKLSFCEVGTAGARELAASPALPRLAQLELSGNSLDDEGLGALLGQGQARTFWSGLKGLFRGAPAPPAPPLSGLRDLDLGCNAIGPDGAAFLAAAPALAGLRVLSLNGNRVGDAGLRALQSSPHLAGLRRLELGYSDYVTAAGLWALAGEPGLPRLASLTLTGLRPGLPPLEGGARPWEGTPLDVKALRALLASPHREALRALSLSDAGLDDGALAALAAEPGLGRLTGLYLFTSNRIGAAGLRALANSVRLSPRCSLVLTPRRPLGPEEMRALCAFFTRPQPLRSLSISYNDPNDDDHLVPWLEGEVAALRAALAGAPGARLEAELKGYSRGTLTLTRGE
jgi:uncharacterized protein (TIGR02996 family)